MSTHEDQERFDIRLENAKHFFKPIITGIEAELAEVRAEQKAYDDLTSGKSLRTLLNRVFLSQVNKTEDIKFKQDQLDFFQELIKRSPAEEFEGMKQFLIMIISHIIREIEDRVNRTGSNYIRWKDTSGTYKAHSIRFLKEGVWLLTQIDPEVAEPFIQRVKRYKLDATGVEIVR